MSIIQIRDIVRHTTPELILWGLWVLLIHHSIKLVLSKRKNRKAKSFLRRGIWLNMLVHVVNSLPATWEGFSHFTGIPLKITGTWIPTILLAFLGTSYLLCALVQDKR